MELSRYNLFFKAKDGRYLLLNTFRRSRFFVDEELKEAIERGTFENVDPEIMQHLLNYGVVDAEGNELSRFTELYRRRVYAPFEYEFTIIPTSQCNLNCFYCERSNITLSLHKYEKFRRFFSSELEKGEFQNVAVRIAGGEPLLYQQLSGMLKDLSQITEEHGKKFFSALATNGILLTQELLDELSLNAVQLTFEGCAAITTVSDTTMKGLLTE